MFLFVFFSHSPHHNMGVKLVFFFQQELCVAYNITRAILALLTAGHFFVYLLALFASMQSSQQQHEIHQLRERTEQQQLRDSEQHTRTGEMATQVQYLLCSFLSRFLFIWEGDGRSSSCKRALSSRRHRSRNCRLATNSW